MTYETVAKMDRATMEYLISADAQVQIALGQELLRLISTADTPEYRQKLLKKLEDLKRDGLVKFPSVEGMTAH